jgi:hypothetical protein
LSDRAEVTVLCCWDVATGAASLFSHRNRGRCHRAAKKNTTHAARRKPHKVHKRKLAKTENLPIETSTSADNILTEAVPTPADPPVAVQATEVVSEPTADSSLIVAPLSTEETTMVNSASPSEPLGAANQLSALDAAAKVLAETVQSLSCPELITAMTARGYWSSPKGRTPASTLYSAILRELQNKGEQSRFVKTRRGKFTLRRTV